MINGILSNGYAFEIDEKVVKSYKFTKLMGLSCSKDPKERAFANAKILGFLLGEKGEEELINYIEEKNGELATEKEVSSCVLEIVQSVTEADERLKKSSTSPNS